jgi:anti-sigma B factor antagonist
LRDLRLDAARVEKLAMPLSLDISRTGDVVVIQCRGRIVFGEEADELRRVILGLLSNTKQIILNLAWVEYVDSCGLGTLVASFISARHRGAEIKLVSVSPMAQRTLRSTHLDRLFETYRFTEDALKSFQVRREAAG